MDKQSVQFLLQQNKLVINDLESDIGYLRMMKREADKDEYKEQEYYAHEALKVVRKKMKKYVAAQKMLKKLMKN